MAGPKKPGELHVQGLPPGVYSANPVKSLVNLLNCKFLQEPRLVVGHHRFLRQCPTTDSSCPTCGQFQTLEETVNMMQRHILQLTARLEQAETKLEVLETCECSVGCSVEGLGSRTHGQTWEADCQSCHCKVNVNVNVNVNVGSLYFYSS